MAHKPLWMVITAMILVQGCQNMGYTQNMPIYTDNQYVNAIRKAEGVWTYGIKTAKCDSEASCKRIALRTIHNNKIRYRKYGYRKYPDFIRFLASRYCPTIGRNLSQSERRLNKNWIHNLRWYLEHPKKG
jgi:hypothetical protein